MPELNMQRLIQTQLLAHQYEGLIKKAKLRGRGRGPAVVRR